MQISCLPDNLVNISECEQDWWICYFTPFLKVLSFPSTWDILNKSSLPIFTFFTIEIMKTILRSKRRQNYFINSQNYRQEFTYKYIMKNTLTEAPN